MIPPDPPRQAQDPASARTPSPGQVKTFLEEPDYTKRLAKTCDVVSKVPFEFIGQPIPVTRKLVPFLCKSFRTGADAQFAASHLDESFFSKFAWETAGTVNNLVATGLASVGFSEAMMARCLEKRVLASTNDVLSWHIAQHGGIWNMVTGAWKGTPFLTYGGAKELRNTLQSSACQNVIQGMVSQAMNGVFSPKEYAKNMTSLFQLQPSSFHRQPELSANVVKHATEMPLPPGLRADAGVLRKAVTAIKPIASNVMPAASLVLDYGAFSKAWRQYQQASPDEANNLVLASVFTTALTLVGSGISTVAMNTFTAPAMPKMTARTGLAFMVTGAVGSSIIDLIAYSRSKKDTKSVE